MGVWKSLVILTKPIIGTTKKQKLDFGGELEQKKTKESANSVTDTTTETYWKPSRVHKNYHIPTWNLAETYLIPIQ